MVLRQPLYRALRDAGHELMLIVRASVAQLVPYVAPGAAVLVLPGEAYRDDLEQHWDLFADLFAAAREWRPDVLLVAPYQWTRFDEKLAEELADVPGLRRAGMTGRLYPGDPYHGPAPKSAMTFDLTANVAEDLPEIAKNAALAAAVLGQPVESLNLAEPQIEPTDAALGEARSWLSDLGLEPGSFWLACVTGTANVPIKSWPATNWSLVLGEWALRHDRRFLFVGLPEERAVAVEVRSGMGQQAGHTAIWMEGGATLDQLIALAHLSAGYVGHDTGPMHIAAAAGKPVLAVFGGGHWPRFLPRATPSVSLTVGVPCVGCGWACSFETSYCVKRIPPGEVLRAAEDLEAGRVTERDARVLEPGGELLARMVAEGARFAQEKLREAGGWSKQAAAIGADRDAKAREAALLGAELAGREAAVAELHREVDRVNREAAGIIEQLHERERAVVAIREAAEEAQRANDQLRQDAAAAEKRAREAERYREQARELQQRLEALEAPRRPRGRPWRQVVTDWAVGTREYIPRTPPRHLATITVAVSLDGATDDAGRAAVQSVFAQKYPHLDLVLCRACETDPPAVVTEFANAADRIVCATGGGFAAVAKAFESSKSDVLAWIDAGEVLEPGALLRAGETFRDHPRTPVVYFENTTEHNGWRTPPPRRPRLDVYGLLASDGFPNVTAFFRRREYKLLGPLDTAKQSAAGWDLLIRFARRYGLRRGPGHGTCRIVDAHTPADITPANGASVPVGPAVPTESRIRASSEDLQAAREAFRGTFGLAGRIRCRVIQTAVRLRAAFARPEHPPSPPLPIDGKPLPLLIPVAGPCVPVFSPITSRPPARLLFTARDTSTPDRRCFRVYYDSAGDATLVHPPIDADEMKALYASRDAAHETVPPDDAFASPFAGYRGGRALDRMLVRLPTPYWRLAGRQTDDPTAERLLALLAGLVARDDRFFRLLNVGCYEGQLLDRLRSFTKWQTAGTENNARAAAVAGSKGHRVWQCTPEDAPMTIPIGQSFDVIFLSGALEHFADPVMVLRRLRQLLAPGGWLALNTPNLDSKLLEIFGPTWARWQAPYHRILLGRRGLSELARTTDFRVMRLRTHTDPYLATASVALNEAGLGAVIPAGAKFPDDQSSRGARAAGWARTLWDWRGRGDVMYALLKAT